MRKKWIVVEANKDGSQTAQKIKEYRKKVGKKRFSDYTCEIMRKRYFERKAAR